MLAMHSALVRFVALAVVVLAVGMAGCTSNGLSGINKSCAGPADCLISDPCALDNL